MKTTKRRALYIIAALFAALFVLSCLAGFAACGGSSEEEHTHTWDAGEITTAATCEGTGVRTYTCTECGETKTETIPATGHTWDNGVVTKVATTDAEGEMTYTCTVCGATKTEKIDKLESSGDDDEGNEPGTGDEGGDENPGDGDENPNEPDVPDVPETEITTEDDLIEALALGGEIELAADITGSSTFTVSAETTLDLAGNTLSSSTAEVITVEAGATLTVKDSASGDDEGGSIAYTNEGSESDAGAAWNTSTNYGEAVKVEEGGSLVLESGTISSSSVGIRAEAVSSDSTGKDTITISGGSIESEYYTIWASGDVDITVSGGTIAGTSKGLFIAGDDKFGYDGVQSGTTTLTITGGTISCEKDSAICTIGNTSGDHKVINISGGKIIGPDLYDEETQNATPMPAIYNASGNLTISGTAEITGSTAVEHRGGALTISGGSLTSSYTGTQNTPAYAKSGATSYGYALTVYPFDHAESVAWNKTMVVSITGGTFTGDMYIANNVLNGTDADGDTVTASISISGMTISGVIVLAETSDLDLDDILGENITVVVSTEIELRWGMAVDGATVKLANDIELNGDGLTDSTTKILLEITNSVTLDLNGKTLSVANNIKSTYTSLDRVLDFELDHFTDLTEENSIEIVITSSANTMGKIDVGPLTYGFVIYGSTNSSNDGLKLASVKISNVEIAASASGGAAAISTNGTGKYGMGTIEVDGCKMTSSTDVCIYIPALDFVIKNSEIEGVTGIEIRGGSLNISNSSVTATGTPSVNWKLGNNGNITTGYAIANTHSSAYANSAVTIGENVTLTGGVYTIVFNETQLDWAVAFDDVSIILGNDIALSNTLEISTTVTLDLNGHKLSCATDDTIKVTETGNLTVVDGSEEKTGTVDATAHGKAALWNEGTVILNGGTFERSAEASTSSSNNGGNSYYTVVNHGTMTINDGVTIFNKGAYSSNLENGWYEGGDETKSATLYVYGGHIYGGRYAIKNDSCGVLYIYGGTIGGARDENDTMPYRALLNWNEAYIYGGTLLGGNGNDSKDEYGNDCDGFAIYNTASENGYESGKLVIGCKEGETGPEIWYEGQLNGTTGSGYGEAIYMDGGTVTINGGRVWGIEYSNQYSADGIYVYGGALTVNGGTISGYYSLEIDGGEVTINGGTFAEPIWFYDDDYSDGTLTFAEGVEDGFEKTMYVWCESVEDYVVTTDETEAEAYKYTQKTETQNEEPDTGDDGNDGDDGGNTEPDDENP